MKTEKPDPRRVKTAGESEDAMKIKAYGYYNYDNVNDQREHLTLTPISDIDLFSSRGASGNVYEFDTEKEYVYSTYYDTYAEETIDCVKIKNGGKVAIYRDNYGNAYIASDNPAYSDFKIEMLGRIKTHKI